MDDETWMWVIFEDFRLGWAEVGSFSLYTESGADIRFLYVKKYLGNETYAC